MSFRRQYAAPRAGSTASLPSRSRHQQRKFGNSMACKHNRMRCARQHVRHAKEPYNQEAASLGMPARTGLKAGGRQVSHVAIARVARLAAPAAQNARAGNRAITPGARALRRRHVKRRMRQHRDGIPQEEKRVMSPPRGDSHACRRRHAVGSAAYSTAKRSTAVSPPPTASRNAQPPFLPSTSAQVAPAGYRRCRVRSSSFSSPPAVIILPPNVIVMSSSEAAPARDATTGKPLPPYLQTASNSMVEGGDRAA